MNGLTVVADDHVLHHAPHDVVEDGHAEEGEAVGPGNKDGADDEQPDAGTAVEILLKVELIVTARRAAIDDGIGARSDHLIESAAALADAGRLSRLAREARFALGTEEVDRRHALRRSFAVCAASNDTPHPAFGHLLPASGEKDLA